MLRRIPCFQKFSKLLRHPFDEVKINRWGRFFVIFTLLFGIAAINSGNNLLYMILAFLLAIMLASGILSTANLIKIDAEVIGSKELYKHSKGFVRIRLRRRRKLPSIGIIVRLNSDPVFLTYLKNERIVEVPFIADRRGYVNCGRLELSSFYPFGFAKRTIYKELKKKVLVYPSISAKGDYRLLLDRQEGRGEDIHRKGIGGEFYGLMPYQFGENFLHIHWKKSTPYQLSVKKFESEMEPAKIFIVPEKIDEHLIDLIATGVNELIKKGVYVGLKGRIKIPPGRGKFHRNTILKALALLK